MQEHEFNFHTKEIEKRGACTESEQRHTRSSPRVGESQAPSQLLSTVDQKGTKFLSEFLGRHYLHILLFGPYSVDRK